MTTDGAERTTTTLATGGGGMTSTSAEPEAPSVAAVIIVEPADTPFTTPLPGSTDAMVALLLDQVTGFPLSVTPDAFLSVTLAGTVCPMVSRVDVRLTAISATRFKAFTAAVESLLHATTATATTQVASLRAPICIFKM